MRVRGHVATPQGLGISDHVCWSYADDRSWRDAALPFLADGRRLGCKLFVVHDRPADELAADLADLPGRDEMLASGQLVIAAVTALYDTSRPIDSDVQLERYRGVLAAARAEGYAGVRAVSDGTPFLRDPALAGSLLAWEIAADRWMATEPVSCLCTIDARDVDPAALDLVLHVHPCAHDPVDFRVLASADGLALAGEIDVFDSTALRAILDGLPDLGGSVVDLTGLRFADRAGLALLADAIAAASGPVTVIGASPLVRRAWSLVDPGHMPEVDWA